MKKYRISHARCSKLLLCGAVLGTALSFFANTSVWATPSAAGISTSLNKGTPKEITNAIYEEAFKEKNGGSFLFKNKTIEHALFSHSLLSLLNKSEDKSQSQDSGPIDFDPVTNSQDPDLKSYSLATEKEDPQNVTIAVALVGGDDTAPLTGADSIVHYDFAYESGGWKINDIRGAADDIPWSLQQILK